MEGNRFSVVAVGASAGGLEAIESFFDSVRKPDGIAFVVIQHLSPDYKSLMDELLAKHTTLPIRTAEDGMPIEPASIYLIPRKVNMSTFNGRLFLTEQQPGLNLPIDVFMKSLADDFGEQAIGVVLSGTGSDGTRGVRTIKEAGGLVLVQDEESAKFDGMPRSAINTGIVDFVLPPHGMPAEIERFVGGSVAMMRSDGETTLTSSSTIARILMLIKRRTGVDLSHYKESTLYRRIERRIGITSAPSVDAYLETLQENPQEITTLYKEILIGVTKFFRDPEAFEVVQSRVIPALVAQINPREQIRVWVPACSTGEEAYGLAILIAEYLEAHGLQHTFRVFATDIDKDAILFASQGLYPESIAADVSAERLRTYFIRKGENYLISRQIRESVIFAYHNVFRDPPFRRIDLLSCRNVLIYFQSVLQQKVLNNFSFSLKEQGFLFLGSSESIGDHAKFFDSYDIRWKIFRSIQRQQRRDAQLEPGSSGLSEFVERIHGATTVRPQVGGMESAYEQLIGDLFPPTVIVTQDRIVEHAFGDVSPFLKLPAGRMELNVMKMAQDPISVPVGDTLSRAVAELRPVTSSGIGMEIGGELRSIDLSVHPIQMQTGDYVFAIIFGRSEIEPTEHAVVRQFNLDEAVKNRIQSLESELQHTKESLQATIEELETSNEELQASNEELMSSNEELQSTNEELQSVNEELITVNAEYQKKIEELSQLNDDMNNLLASTQVGTLFLDPQLRIRKFNGTVGEHFKIIKSDVGRPISDLSHTLEYETLLSDVQQVLEQSQAVEREARSADGRWYLIRIIPYNDGRENQGGVVVTLIEVTRRRIAELALERQVAPPQPPAPQPPAQDPPQ